MKSTKKSFIMSLLSLMLCFAMLLGTTYAWFTDSVTSGRNKIIAGNLDVALYHNGTEVTADTADLFNNIKWEPGVIAYENFRVSNQGSLALKYNFSLNVYKKNTCDGHDLSEVIKAVVVDGGFNATGNASADRAAAQQLGGYATLQDFNKTGKLAAGNTTGDTFGVVLYWEPTANDNQWNVNNGKTVSEKLNGKDELFIEFGVNLVAYQDTVESDSFDKLYDETATPLEILIGDPITGEVNEDIKVEEKGAVKEATVTADTVNEVFNEMKVEGADNSLTLQLNVEEKGSDETSVNFDIDLTAIMKSTKGGVTTTNEKKLENLDDFVEAKLIVGANRLGLVAKHNGNAMTKVENKADIESATENPNGYYSYNSSNDYATIWLKSFSPIGFNFEKLKTDAELLAENPNYTCRIGNTGYVYPFGQAPYSSVAATTCALKNAQDGDTIKMIQDYTTTNSFYATTIKDARVITIDLNGKTVNVGSNLELNGGHYNIIDSSEEGTGRIPTLSLNGNQGYATEINVYGGNFGKIYTTGTSKDKTVNFFGGNATLIEIQGTDKGDKDTLSISGGNVSYVSFYNNLDVASILTLSNGFTLGDEITGDAEAAIRSYADNYKTYPIQK